MRVKQISKEEFERKVVDGTVGGYYYCGDENHKGEFEALKLNEEMYPIPQWVSEYGYYFGDEQIEAVEESSTIIEDINTTENIDYSTDMIFGENIIYELTRFINHFSGIIKKFTYDSVNSKASFEWLKDNKEEK